MRGRGLPVKRTCTARRKGRGALQRKYSANCLPGIETGLFPKMHAVTGKSGNGGCPEGGVKWANYCNKIFISVTEI